MFILVVSVFLIIMATSWSEANYHDKQAAAKAARMQKRIQEARKGYRRPSKPTGRPY